MPEKIVVIHQPDFLPYLGFFHRLLRADLFIILDNVQFTRGGKNCWHYRDKIKTPQGEKWITINTKSAHLGTNINQVLLANYTNWKEKHLNMFITNYSKAPFFKEIFFYIEKLYTFNSEKLVDFNIRSIDMLMKLFDIKIECILASDLKLSGKSNILVVNLLQKMDATHYLSGIGARDYFDPLPFQQANIEVIWQDFKHPVYPQINGDFIPFLSSIDLFFNCGITKAREIIRSI